jgi:hypothetical protein
MDAHTNLVGHKQWCCRCGQGQSRGRCTTSMPIAGVPQSMESASHNPKSPKMGHTPCDLASDARYWTHYNTTHPCTSYLSLKTVIRLPRVTTKACGALTIEKLSARGEIGIIHLSSLVVDKLGQKLALHLRIYFLNAAQTCTSHDKHSLAHNDQKVCLKSRFFSNYEEVVISHTSCSGHLGLN